MKQRILHIVTLLLLSGFVAFSGNEIESGGGFGQQGYSAYRVFENGWPFSYLSRTVIDSNRMDLFRVWRGQSTIFLSGALLNIVFLFFLVITFFSDVIARRTFLSVWALRSSAFIALCGIAIIPNLRVLEANAHDQKIMAQLESIGCDVTTVYSKIPLLSRIALDGFLDPRRLEEVQGVSTRLTTTEESATVMRLCGDLKHVRRVKIVEAEILARDVAVFSRSPAGKTIGELSFAGCLLHGCPAFPSSRKLERLNLARLEIRETSLDCIVDSILEIPRLQELDVSGVPLTIDHVRKLIGTKINTIDISECGLSEEEVQRLKKSTHVEIFSDFDRTIRDEVHDFLDEIGEL